MTNTNTAIPSFRTSTATRYDAIPSDTYPARLVRFVGLGVQDQPDFQGQKKDPAFKCAVQYELLGMDATGTKGDGTPVDAGRPACVFQDYFLFPGATRGKVYEMCRAIDASIEKSPANLEWFIEKLGELVLVQVGQYTTRDGVVKNKVVAVTPMPSFMKASQDAARSDLVGFNPYVDNDNAMAAYSKMFKFQRDMLMEAHDSQNIPMAGKEPLVAGNTDGESSQAAASTATNTPVDGGFDDGDDIPF